MYLQAAVSTVAKVQLGWGFNMTTTQAFYTSSQAKAREAKSRLESSLLVDSVTWQVEDGRNVVSVVLPMANLQDMYNRVQDLIVVDSPE